MVTTEKEVREREAKARKLEFGIVCKVCKQTVDEDESLLEHMQKHDVTNYFDLIPVLEWD